MNMDSPHFKFSSKPVASLKDGLRDGVVPLGGLILITCVLVALLALCIHFGHQFSPIIPVHEDDGELVDPNPLRFAYMIVGMVVAFLLAHWANGLGRSGNTMSAFWVGYAGGTLLWQASGECAWHFSIVGDGYLMCFPHLEGASAIFLVVMSTVLLAYCWKRKAFEWGIWVFVLSFIGNWFGHFVMIGTYPLVSGLMEEASWYRISGWVLGMAVVLAALALDFFAARTRKARLCCSLMLYFGIGIIVTGVAGI